MAKFEAWSESEKQKIRDADTTAEMGAANDAMHDSLHEHVDDVAEGEEEESWRGSYAAGQEYAEEPSEAEDASQRYDMEEGDFEHLAERGWVAMTNQLKNVDAVR